MDIRNLKRELDHMTRDVEQIKKSLDVTRVALKKKRDEHVPIQNELDALNNEIEVFENKLRRNLQTRTELANKKSAMEIDIDKLEDSMGASEAELQEKMRQVDEMKRAFEDAQRDLEKMERDEPRRRSII